METHSNVLAWRIPGMGEPGGLPPVESHRVGNDWSNLAAPASKTHFNIAPGSAVVKNPLANSRDSGLIPG